MMQDLTGMPAVGERIDTGSVALGLPEFVVWPPGSTPARSSCWSRPRSR